MNFPFIIRLSHYELENYFLIVPSNWDESKVEKLYKQKPKKLNHCTSYNSGESTNFLSIAELRKLIRDNLDSECAPK